MQVCRFTYQIDILDFSTDFLINIILITLLEITSPSLIEM